MKKQPSRSAIPTPTETACAVVADEGSPDAAPDAASPDLTAGEDTPAGGGDSVAGADSGGSAAEEPAEVTSSAGGSGCSSSAGAAPAWPLMMPLLFWLWARRKRDEDPRGVGSPVADVVLYGGGHDAPSEASGRFD